MDNTDHINPTSENTKAKLFKLCFLGASGSELCVAKLNYDCLTASDQLWLVQFSQIRCQKINRFHIIEPKKCLLHDCRRHFCALSDEAAIKHRSAFGLSRSGHPGSGRCICG